MGRQPNNGVGPHTQSNSVNMWLDVTCESCALSTMLWVWKGKISCSVTHCHINLSPPCGLGTPIWGRQALIWNPFLHYKLPGYDLQVDPLLHCFQCNVEYIVTKLIHLRHLVFVFIVMCMFYMPDILLLLCLKIYGATFSPTLEHVLQ